MTAGAGYNAALEFLVPHDGDYILGASGWLSSAGRTTYGGYRLLLGMDAPEVLDGKAVPNGAMIAKQDETRLGAPGRIQEYTGSLDANQPSMTLALYDFDAGDTLSVFVEAISGDLKPILVLRDYGGKPVSLSNYQGTDNQASLEYAFPKGGQDYSLDIYAAAQEEQPTSGEFRLLAGVDAPR